MSVNNQPCWYRHCLVCLVVLLSASGCASILSDDSKDASELINDIAHQTSPNTMTAKPQQGVNTLRRGVSLNQYAETIALHLSDQFVPTDSVVVASFVDFDGSLHTTHALGNQLAEALRIALPAKGYTVREINAADSISMEPNGSFILNRNEGRMLSSGYAVAGTLIYANNGVTVNTRLFDIKTERVVAATVITLPQFLFEGV